MEFFKDEILHVLPPSNPYFKALRGPCEQLVKIFTADDKYGFISVIGSGKSVHFLWNHECYKKAIRNQLSHEFQCMTRSKMGLYFKKEYLAHRSPSALMKAFVDLRFNRMYNEILYIYDDLLVYLMMSRDVRHGHLDCHVDAQKY